MAHVVELLQTKPGKVSVYVGTLACIVLAIWSIHSALAGNAAMQMVNTRVFVDAETGQSFTVEMTPTTMMPVVSPFTGNADGYPAELCYWTADGQIKDTPTAVLLNSQLNPGSREPTFCPDCGRLVVPHNPKPKPGDTPPPTRAQYYAEHGNSPTP
jgi:hypothetical protein